MEKKRLQNLAQKIQLEIKEGELSNYLENFAQLERLLTNFKKVWIGKNVRPMKRIDIGCLTLRKLKKLENFFSQPRISKKNQKKNSSITDEGFVSFKK